MKAPASRDLQVLFLLLSSFEQLYATFELIQHPKPVKIRIKIETLLPRIPPTQMKNASYGCKLQGTVIPHYIKTLALYERRSVETRPAI